MMMIDSGLLFWATL